MTRDLDVFDVVDVRVVPFTYLERAIDRVVDRARARIRLVLDVEPVRLTESTL